MDNKGKKQVRITFILAGLTLWLPCIGNTQNPMRYLPVVGGIVTDQFGNPAPNVEISMHRYRTTKSDDISRTDVTTTNLNTLNLNSPTLHNYPIQNTRLLPTGEIKISLFDSLHNPVRNSCSISLIGETNNMAKSLTQGFTDPTIDFSHLSQGHYSLYLDVYGYPIQYYNPQGNTHNSEYQIFVAQNEVKHLSVILRRNPVLHGFPNISGYVKNSEGEPLIHATVTLIDSTMVHWHQWFNISHMETEFSAQTDSNGYYSIFDVRPGKYIVLASTEIENYQHSFYPNTQTLSEATVLTMVDQTTQADIHFLLQKGSEISGYVKNEQGQSISDIAVTLYQKHDTVPMNSTIFFYEVKSDNNGKFTFLGIPSGIWYTDAWDPSDLYLYFDNEWKNIQTTGSDVQVIDPIIMKPGGSLHGTFTIPNDTSHNTHIGSMFIHSETISDTNDHDRYWPQWQVGIHRETMTGEYRTNAIPKGRWKIVVAPNPNYSLNLNTISPNVNFIPFLRWSFIDGAHTFHSTKTTVIESFKKTRQEINFYHGGYALFGNIRTDNNDTLGNQTSTNMVYAQYYVGVFIKDGERFIQIAESHDVGNNRFTLAGLVDGQQYYFNASADTYRDQWWNGILDSATCKPSNAAVYTFSTTNFQPISIYLMKKPEGFKEWEKDGPAAIKNQTITPIGLTSVRVSWTPSPPEDSVTRYCVYKIKHATEDMFYLNPHGFWEPINEDSLLVHLDSFFVTDTVFFDTNVEPSVSYLYLVVGFDKKNHEGESMPKGDDLQKYFTKISYATFGNTTTSVYPEKWQMLGICGLDSINVKNSSGTTKLYQWDEGFDSSKLHLLYTEIDYISPGSGAWVYSYDHIPLTMSEHAFNRLVTQKSSITIPINKGWNQLSSPFPYSISPDWFNNNYVAYGWNAKTNSYYESRVLSPWKAYWLHSTVDTTLALSSIPFAAQKRSISPRKKLVGWELSVSLMGQKSSDPDNYCGTLDSELSRMDTYATTEPPQAFDYPHLYFISGSEKYSKHYLSSTAIPTQKLEWKVGVSPLYERMNIVIKRQIPVPEVVQLFWVTNTGTINLQITDTIPLYPHSGPQFGYIMATANPADIALYTGRFMMKRNVPNPFTTSTRIEFTVPYGWNNNGSKSDKEKQKLSLSIYNITGQRVSTLHSGTIAVGHHRKVWNGRDDNGISLPSGMYIAHLKSSRYSKAIQMFKVQ